MVVTGQPQSAPTLPAPVLRTDRAVAGLCVTCVAAEPPTPFLYFLCGGETDRDQHESARGIAQTVVRRASPDASVNRIFNGGGRSPAASRGHADYTSGGDDEALLGARRPWGYT